MDFEDIFVNRNKHNSKYRTRDYYQGGSRSKYDYSGGQEKFNPFELLASIRRNKKLRIVLIAILAALVIIIIGLILILLPFIGNIINYIYQNGVSGVIQVVMDYLNTFWSGAN